MRKRFTKFAFTAAFGLAFAFTFGCLENKGGGGCPNAATVDNIVNCAFQNYKTVQIGKQIWMAENLNYDVPDNDTDMCYNNDPANCAKYGRLYNWATAMALPLKCNSILSTDDAACAIKTPYHQGICPEGWHIPNVEEWNILMRFGEKRLRAKSGWNSYVHDPCCAHECNPGCTKKPVTMPGNGTDDYGFTALTGGSGYQLEGKLTFGGVGYGGLWWAASELNDNSAYRSNITNDDNYEGDDYGDKGNLFISIRCMKDY
jgi:uncharacterized protein (TIGR02145 family)